ncbi:Uncharacterised protein [Vibrio cholerae]|nr:Uncharacterised protein [Vibrio cholerae]
MVLHVDDPRFILIIFFALMEFRHASGIHQHMRFGKRDRVVIRVIFGKLMSRFFHLSDSFIKLATC